MGSYILHIEYTKDGEHDFLHYADKDIALEQAAAEIQETIYETWDLNSYDQALEARSINKLVKAGDYSGAIDEWNNCTSNVCKENVQISVYYESFITTSVKPRIFDNDAFLILQPPVSSGYPATQPSAPSGAACRACQNYNQYAIPDRADGTFLCYSCKS